MYLFFFPALPSRLRYPFGTVVDGFCAIDIPCYFVFPPFFSLLILPVNTARVLTCSPVPLPSSPIPNDKAVSQHEVVHNREQAPIISRGKCPSFTRHVSVRARPTPILYTRTCRDLPPPLLLKYFVLQRTRGQCSNNDDMQDMSMRTAT